MLWMSFCLGVALCPIAVRRLGGVRVTAGLTVTIGLLGMATILGMIIVALDMLPDEKKLTLSVLAVYGMSRSLINMSKAVKAFGEMTPEELAKGLLALAVSLAAIVLAMKYMEEAKAGSLALVVAVAALAFLVPILKSLGGMSVGAVAKALIILGGSFLILGIAAKALGGQAIPILYGLAGVLAVIGLSIFAVGVGIGTMAAGLTALAVSGVAGAESLVAALTVLVNGLLGMVSPITDGIASMFGAMLSTLKSKAGEIASTAKALFLSLLSVFTEIIPETVESLFLLIQNVLAKLVEYVPQIMEYLVQFFIKVVDFLSSHLAPIIEPIVKLFSSIFSSVIEAITTMDEGTLLEFIAGIGMLVGIMIGLSFLAGLAPTAMLGVLAFGVVIAELALVLAAIGALAQIPGLNWLVNEGGALMADIGHAIGGFIGGIVGGVMGGISAEFPKIGEDLSKFMKAIDPFVEGAKKIDASTMEGVKELVKTIAILTATEILSGIKKFIGGGESSLTAFAKELAEFGPALKTYSDKIEGINPENVKASAEAALALANMANAIPNSNGLVAKITGDNSLSDFGAELVLFGPSLLLYSISVNGLNVDAIVASAEATLALTTMANAIPNTGGLIKKVTGDNSLAEFGAELALFGPLLKLYAASVADVTPQSVEASSRAISIISEVATEIPDISGGVFSKGEMEKFGIELVKFGKSFAEYCGTVKDVDTDKLNLVIAEFEWLVSVATGIKGVDTDKMSEFGKGLKTLAAAGISDFIKAFTDAESTITNTAKVMLATFIAGVKSKQDDLSKAFTTVIQTAVASIDETKVEFASAGKTLMSQLIAGIETRELTAKSALNAIIANCKSIIEKHYDAFQNAGTTLMTNFVTGLRVGAAETTGVFTTTLDTVLTTIRALYSNFYNAGKYLVEGFAAGIKDSAYLATAEAKAMGKATAISIETELGIESPSTVAYKIGEYFDLGFLNGITDGIPSVSDAGFDLGDSALTSLGIGASPDLSYDYGEVFGDSFVSGVDSKLPSSADAGLALGDYSLTGLDSSLYSDESYDYGEYFSQSYVDGINDSSVEGYEAGSSLADSTKEGLTNSVSSDGAYNIGIYFSDGFVNAIKDSADGSGEAGSGLVEAAKTGLRNAVYELNDALQEALTRLDDTMTAYKNAGAELIIGFTDGMKMFEPKLKETLESIFAELTSTGQVFATVNAAFSDAGTSFMNHLIENVQSGEKPLSIILSEMMDRVLAGLRSSKASGFREAGAALTEEFAIGANDNNAAGSEFIKQFIAGVQSNGMTLESVMKMLLETCKNVIVSKYMEFERTGETLMIYFVGAIQKSEVKVLSAFSNTMGAALNIIRNSYSGFYSAGGYLVEGFAAGITANTFMAAARAKAMAEAALAAARAALAIASPSKAAYKIGEYFGEGFVNAVTDYTTDSYEAGSEMANAAKAGLTNSIAKIADLINDGIDTQPTIRPVLDLSNVEAGAQKLSAMFSRTQAASISVGMNKEADTKIQNGMPTDAKSDTYSFVQNNYSPKALSRYEIYRQTRNQIATLRGVGAST
jgi:hypothetical protein